MTFKKKNLICGRPVGFIFPFYRNKSRGAIELWFCLFCGTLNIEKSLNPYPASRPTPLPPRHTSASLSFIFTNLSLYVYLHTGINGFSVANCGHVFFCWLALCFSNQSSESLYGTRLFFQARGHHL